MCVSILNIWPNKEMVKQTQNKTKNVFATNVSMYVHK